MPLVTSALNGENVNLKKTLSSRWYGDQEKNDFDWREWEVWKWLLWGTNVWLERARRWKVLLDRELDKQTAPFIGESEYMKRTSRSMLLLLIGENENTKSTPRSRWRIWCFGSENWVVEEKRERNISLPAGVGAMNFVFRLLWLL